MEDKKGALTEFIRLSKELLDFTRCSIMATKYRESFFNFRYYGIQLKNVEDRMMSKDDVVNAVFNRAIDNYFDGTNITDAINDAIEDVKKETGQDPREVVLRAIRKEV